VVQRSPEWIEGIPSCRSKTGPANNRDDILNGGLAVVAGLFVDMFFHQHPAKIIGAGQKSQLPGRNISENQDDWMWGKLSSTSRATAMMRTYLAGWTGFLTCLASGVRPGLKDQGIKLVNPAVRS
jgi:hypothetical protein